MSIQPTFFDIEIPGNSQLMEVCIGFSWGGDATVEIARADSHAFKDAVLAAFQAALAAAPGLVLAMAEESHPLNGQCRYSGGRTSKQAQALLDNAVESASRGVRLSRPCAAVLMER